MLAEMEAYAAQALKIDSLERQVKILQGELANTIVNTLTVEEVKSWLSISRDYCFLNDFGKSECLRLFGAKND